MEILIPFLSILVAFVMLAFLFRNKLYRNTRDEFYKNLNTKSDQWKRRYMSRGEYYRKVYLQSDEWKRKRYVVLKRDKWRCVYCGKKATQVHHKKYAPKNIGKEPIDWLVSICKTCHEAAHR